MNCSVVDLLLSFVSVTLSVISFICVGLQVLKFPIPSLCRPSTVPATVRLHPKWSSLKKEVSHVRESLYKTTTTKETTTTTTTTSLNRYGNSVVSECIMNICFVYLKGLSLNSINKHAFDQVSVLMPYFPMPMLEVVIDAPPYCLPPTHHMQPPTYLTSPVSFVARE